MEVLFVSHKYPPVVGGMEKQSYELVTGMATCTGVHKLVYDGRESRFRFFLSLGSRIRKVLKANPAIELIHFNDALIAAVALLMYPDASCIKCVTVHGLDVVFPSRIYQKYILPLFNRFDSIIAVSRATADECVKRGIASHKVCVINNGVDSRFYYQAREQHLPVFVRERAGIELEGRPLLVMMGRPVKRKGFSWFLREVVPLLRHDFAILIIGPLSSSARPAPLIRMLPALLGKQIQLLMAHTTDETELAQLLEQEHLKSRVRHIGRLSDDHVVSVLTSADAFLMPNIEVEGDMEGFGLVCLEASLCGATVFAANTGGIPDAIIHEKNGILIPAGDKEKWAEQLNAFLTCPGRLKELSENFREYSFQNYSWKKMVADYFAHFSDLQRTSPRAEKRQMA